MSEEIECNEVNIRLVAYDESRQVLRVEYQNAKIYDYFDFPLTMWAELSKAERKGDFLAQRVKGFYRYYHVNGD